MKYEGIKFINAGRELIIPALGIQQARDHKEEIQKYYDRPKSVADGTFRVTDLADDIPLIQLAVSRNYPGILESEISDFVDFNNYNGIMSAILGTNKSEKVSATSIPN